MSAQPQWRRGPDALENRLLENIDAVIAAVAELDDDQVVLVDLDEIAQAMPEAVEEDLPVAGWRTDANEDLVVPPAAAAEMIPELDNLHLGLPSLARRSGACSQYRIGSDPPAQAVAVEEPPAEVEAEDEESSEEVPLVNAPPSPYRGDLEAQAMANVANQVRADRLQAQQAALEELEELGTDEEIQLNRANPAVREKEERDRKEKREADAHEDACNKNEEAMTFVVERRNRPRRARHAAETNVYHLQRKLEEWKDAHPENTPLGEKQRKWERDIRKVQDQAAYRRDPDPRRQKAGTRKEVTSSQRQRPRTKLKLQVEKWVKLHTLPQARLRTKGTQLRAMLKSYRRSRLLLE
eukprot:g20477.t1